MDEQRRKNLLDARMRVDLQVLDLESDLARFKASRRPLVPDDDELNELRGLEDDISNALDRVKRARLDTEIFLNLEKEARGVR
jgi:hypothetical protein